MAAQAPRVDPPGGRGGMSKRSVVVAGPPHPACNMLFLRSSSRSSYLVFPIPDSARTPPEATVGAAIRRLVHLPYGGSQSGRRFNASIPWTGQGVRPYLFPSITTGPIKSSTSEHRPKSTTLRLQPLPRAGPECSKIYFHNAIPCAEGWVALTYSGYRSLFVTPSLAVFPISHPFMDDTP